MYPYRWRSVAVYALVLIFAVAPRAMAGFSFINIADTSIAAPGGGTFSGFSIYPRPGDAGDIYFQASASGGASQGLYRYRNGNLSRLVGVGESAPGGGTFTGIDLPTVRDNTVAFRASTEPTGIAAPSVYVLDSGGLRRVAAYNGRMPNSPSGGRFSGFSVPTVAGDGRIAFGGQSTNDFSHQGLFVTGASGLTRIVTDGDPAPGGGNFSFGFAPVVPYQSVSGQILFSVGTVNGGPVNAAYLYNNGVLSRVVARNDPAPGGGNFLGTVAVALTGDNRPFIWGTASSGGPVRTGIFAGDGRGGLTQLVAGGQSAPGGGTFSDVRPPYVSASGDYAFVGIASGKQGVYLGSASSLSLITSVGDPLFGSTITALAIQVGFGSVDSRPSVDAAGQVAFYYELANGRKGLAMAMAGVAAAPEPSSLTYLSLAFLLLSALSRCNGVSVIDRRNPAKVDAKR